MSVLRTARLATLSALVICLLGIAAAPALAAPTTAADAARVDAAISRLDAARARADAIDAKREAASARLDEIVADIDAAQSRLSARVHAMYRSGDTAFVSVLLGAATFQEFASRWMVLTRMSEQDAQALEDLAIAKTEAEKSAASLISLQEQSAKAVDDITREVARSRKELAASRAALAAYRARSTGSAKRAPIAKKPAARRKDSRQALRGTGAWKSGVASHYSRTFTGRGASGKRIGPYSMMVAHKTLPFGTLIEFQYNGKRCVASVEDRGPHSAGRMFDLGPGVVRVLGFSGVHSVKYRIIKR